MDNFETLLKYQELDIKLKRALDSIDKSDPNRKMEQARSEFNNAKKTVQDSERDAQAVVSDFEASSKQFEEITEKLNEIQLIIENAEPDDDLGAVADQLESLKSKAAAFEKKLSDLKANSEKLVKNYQDANARGLKMRDVFNSAKNEYSELVKSSEPEVNSIKKAQKELEAQIPPELMQKYKTLTAENIYPAFVEVRVTGNTYSCNGCGILLSQKNISTLNENGMCSCENCRRMIYKV